MQAAWDAQAQRNAQVLGASRYLKGDATSKVLPLQFALAGKSALTQDEELALQALGLEAARTAIKSLASLAKIGELDHLGGGLDLIPALAMTLACTDYEKVEYTIENAHCSIGYYSLLAAYGFVREDDVVHGFRRGLDIAGHVSWLPGGTQLNGGRLGIMVPAAVGQALGLKAIHGQGAWVVCHCGDAGWISGQALNGFNGAHLHGAPVTFVMHRNGIQLSGSNQQIMDKDMRPIVKSLGVEILEIPSLHDTRGLFAAYRAAFQLAQQGRPSMIYPVGYRSDENQVVDLRDLGRRYGIAKEVAEYAAANKVPLETRIWIPGALMSYGDVSCMLDCVFLVNNLPGGKGHHDGSMKGRDEAKVLGSPMLQATPAQAAALAKLRQQPPRQVVTLARPRPGAPNLVVPREAVAAVALPEPGKSVSPRNGVEAAYDLVAKTHPDKVFIVSCDLDPSTKLGKARSRLAATHQFEMSIEEQVSAIMANGLAVSSRRPQLNVFSTFAAFFEGIAREGFEMWRYQRNLNGSNEGLNVTMHLSHVGACTGRDHFSGWSLDWITLALGYLPYLHRFYTPADARSAYIAVLDLAAHYGAHIIGIPRDNLPILTQQDGKTPLWAPTDAWEPLTLFRRYPKAKKVILALGATAFVGEQAAKLLTEQGTPTDVYVVNGFPFDPEQVAMLLKKYRAGVVTIEDGLIGCPCTGLRGLAGMVAGAAAGTRVKLAHVGIVDPRIAPAEGHHELWEHFGLTAPALVQAVQAL